MPPRPTDVSRLAGALFQPKSVALIGISDDAGKTAGRPLRFLRKHGFANDIYPVNSRRQTVQGERAYASLAEVPGEIDHAYILVNTPAVEEAVTACAARGVKVATILAAGFAEAGAEGRARQQRLVEIAGEAGLRLVGPNSLGVVNTRTGLTLTANASFAADELPRGRLTVISQSGSLLGTFISRGGARGIGFAKMISVGNEADLSVGEIGAALVADTDTDAFLLFLETVRRPEEVARFAAQARHAGKPVIAYKLGRSEAGQELALSHTGAMIGSDAAAEAFLRHHGILRVDHLETLLEVAPLLIGRAPPSSPTRSVGVVATTGGGAAMVVDRLGVLGVDVAAPSEATAQRLKAAGIAAEPGRILDLTLAGARYDIMRAALDTLLAAPEFALVVAVVGSSAQFNPELAVKPIIDCAGHAKPIAVFLTPHADQTLELLAQHRVAAFRTPEACADGIAAYLAWTPPAATTAVDERALAAARTVLEATPGEVLDEQRSSALFAALGVPVAASVTLGLDGALDAPLPFPFPVAAKVLSADIPHKTDAGGVALGIASPDELATRVAVLVAAVRERRPDAHLDGILVQPMTDGVAEVLVGYRLDPQVGPVVTVGMGGTLAEIYRDFALRLAPVSAAEAAEMIAEVRGLAVLRGFRGKPAGDVAALADAIARVSALAHLPAVVEAEINPLIVKPAGDGVIAVDGLVRRSRG